MTDWLNVGKIVNTHGIHGEVRVISKTDFPEQRYKAGNMLYILKDGNHRVPVTVRSWRQHKQFDLVSFEDMENVNLVETYKGSLLQVHTSQLDDHLGEGEFYYHEIIGLSVETEEGKLIGAVKEILSPGANDVWVVQPEGKGKEVLIPYIDDVVKEIKLNEQKIIITPMEGLLD
ncbi:ribosome maturation factor RimM [Salipaludibacillus aurantiacus]|uniref:Ribosome maturation factor RimM n=1 Tax=Salipaludibacillus aurantiacus TaxID=1601833 RepID=A0A1H9QMZ6_9BACI|nr:ribosome maturation factor RimM [Salipaludibacillus aurantiacus]SER61777.1 16S rRNA processing protein RimM [Salipaludibacillus aurantiacus]